MTKTCGTCANGNRGVVFCEIDGVMYGVDKVGSNNCEHYTERTDSVEKVAQDMLTCISRLSERGTCHMVFDEGLPACEYAGSLEPCYVMFDKRLQNLGVISSSLE